MAKIFRVGSKCINCEYSETRHQIAYRETCGKCIHNPRLHSEFKSKEKKENTNG